MLSHAPPGYDCIFCRLVHGRNSQATSVSASDVILQTAEASAFLSLSRRPKNPVDVLVVPNKHFESLYDLPFPYALPLHQLTRAVALTLKAVYQCDGISTRQHNEPAGDQDVWHYHIHVTPRFKGDDFYRSRKVSFPEPERFQHARQLRDYLAVHGQRLLAE